MKTVYKYQIDPFKWEYVLPKGSQVLSVANQRDEMVFYAKVDTDELETETIKLGIAGTGHDLSLIRLPADATFLGTIKMYDGDLMFHVWYWR